MTEEIRVNTFGSYQKRAQQVYWDRLTPACRSGGPGQAQCLLGPDHGGRHHGNGFDDWGPKAPIWWGWDAAGLPPMPWEDLDVVR